MRNLSSSRLNFFKYTLKSSLWAKYRCRNGRCFMDAFFIYLFFSSFVHLLAAVALRDELLTLFGLCTLKMNTLSPRPCVHSSDSEKETVVCRPRDKPSRSLSFLFLCLSPVSPLFYTPYIWTSSLGLSSLSILLTHPPWCTHRYIQRLQ